MYTFAPKHRLASLLVVGCLMGVSGCGTNFDEVLYQTATATGQTFLDILLTDLASTLADSFDQGAAPAPGDELGDEAPPSDGPPLEELTGDPDVGEGIYASNSCAPCHCADSTGGCALGAPSLVGVAAEPLDDRLRGNADHTGGKFDITNQDIVDMQAYLASLTTDNG